mmetsp:Transcript_97505/g.281336  ORF Transcript_97505/g.281336 Transcript_97505/m.281336 type:complete len:181 (+) Transcript_97505:81-623(+)
MSATTAPRVPCVVNVGMVNPGMECHRSQEQQGKQTKQHKVRVGKLYSCDRRRLMNRFRAQAEATARAESESSSQAEAPPSVPTVASPKQTASPSQQTTPKSLWPAAQPWPQQLEFDEHIVREGAAFRQSSPHSSSSDTCSSNWEAWDQEPVKLVRRASGGRRAQGSLEIVSFSLAQHLSA